MSDIVERLRAASLNRDELRGGWLAEAIDEIERLRGENVKLRGGVCDEVLVKHSGADSRREWASGSTWLYAGDAIVVLRSSLPLKPGDAE